MASKTNKIRKKGKANNKVAHKDSGGAAKRLAATWSYADKRIDSILEKPLDKIDKKVKKLGSRQRVFYFYLFFAIIASVIVYFFIKLSFLRIFE